MLARFNHTAVVTFDGGVDVPAGADDLIVATTTRKQDLADAVTTVCSAKGDTLDVLRALENALDLLAAGGPSPGWSCLAVLLLRKAA